MEEKPKTIYFTDDPETDIVHPDFITDEKFAETGAVVVYCILGVFVMAIAVTIYCLL